MAKTKTKPADIAVPAAGALAAFFCIHKLFPEWGHVFSLNDEKKSSRDKHAAPRSRRKRGSSREGYSYDDQYGRRGGRRLQNGYDPRDRRVEYHGESGRGYGDDQRLVSPRRSRDGSGYHNRGYGYGY